MSKNFWKDKKVLVTGGLGFLGSHLANRLLDYKADVIVVDLPGVDKKNLENGKDKLSIVDCDVSSRKIVEKRIDKNISIVFHLAANAIPSFCEKNPEITFKNNVIGTFNILKFSLDNKIEKLIFSSTAQLYGRYPKYLPIDEKHPIEYFDNVYSFTKKLDEDLCEIFYRKYGLPLIYLRLFNAFGPRQTTDFLIPSLISQGLEKNTIELWSDKPTRDFTFVHDTITALMGAAESSFCGGPINVGSGREIKVADVAQQIAKQINAKLNFLNKEVVGSMRLRCDNTLAKNILNWEPKIDFPVGLNKTVEWFKKNKKKRK